MGEPQDRARGDRQRRVRRTGAAVFAAATVAAIAIGGTQLVPQAATPVVTPAGTPSPSVSPGPSGPPPLTPSPRPTPRAPVSPAGPITEVDWAGPLELTLPAHDGCPSGRVQLQDGLSRGDYPRLAVGPAFDGTIAAYGDVTGDGETVAVVSARCFSSHESLSSGHGWRLLAVRLADDGTLTGLGWLGPAGAAVLDAWVADGRVLIDADPWTVAAEEHFPAVPGLALSYRWDGSGFVGWEPADEYPPIAPLGAPTSKEPSVALGAVATGLGCSEGEVAFVPEPSGWGWSGSGDDALYTIHARAHQQYLFDLDHTGDRLLVVELGCVRESVATTGLAIFEVVDEVWQGISVLRHPHGHRPASWSYSDGRMQVEWSDDTESATSSYRWNGTVFEPAEG